MNDQNKMYTGNVYTRITEYMSSLDNGSVDYYIGLAFLSRLHYLPEVYIEEIAMLAKTTKSSVTKFCHKVGYDSFSDLRNDMRYYTKHSFIAVLNQFSFGSLEEYQRTIMEADQHLVESYISSLDLEKVKRAGRDISRGRSVLFLAGDYNKNIVSVFGEQLFIHDIILTVVNRNNDESEILAASKNADVIMMSCLSGKWLREREQLVKRFTKPFYVLSLQTMEEENVICPTYSLSGLVTESFYESQRFLQVIFFLLNYYILQERKDLNAEI